MLNCQFQDFRFPDRKRSLICKLGLYGGQVTLGLCKACIAKGQNNEAYARELFAKAERTHPSTAKRVSGCCDSAKNYI